MAKSVVQKISDAITGGGKPDLSGFTVAADPEVVAAKAAEDAATKRAHELESGLGELVAARHHHDAAYTTTAGMGDEVKVREARRVFIASDESVRARQDHIRRAQLAATAARQKREAVEIEAEVRIKAKIHEALAVEVGIIVKAVDEVLVPALERAEALADAAEQFASWGSPTSQRVGYVAGLGYSGHELFRARGHVHRLGAHTIGGSFLHDQHAPDGNTWGTWRKTAVALGLLEGE